MMNRFLFLRVARAVIVLAAWTSSSHAQVQETHAVSVDVGKLCILESDEPVVWLPMSPADWEISTHDESKTCIVATSKVINVMILAIHAADAGSLPQIDRWIVSVGGSGPSPTPPGPEPPGPGPEPEPQPPDDNLSEWSRWVRDAVVATVPAADRSNKAVRDAWEKITNAITVDVFTGREIRALTDEAMDRFPAWKEFEVKRRAADIEWASTDWKSPADYLARWKETLAGLQAVPVPEKVPQETAAAESRPRGSPLLALGSVVVAKDPREQQVRAGYLFERRCSRDAMGNATCWWVNRGRILSHQINSYVVAP